jgi:hypothetical protein
LREEIKYQQAAVDHTTVGDFEEASRKLLLLRLDASLLQLYHSRMLDYLDRAIQYQQAAADLTTVGDYDKLE